MRRVARRLDGYWLAPAPAERLALLRILVGGFGVLYLAVFGWNLVSVAGFEGSQFEPVGVVGALGSPLAASLVYGLVVATFVAGLGFVAGWRFRLSGPAFALLLLAVTSYRSSWGQIFHTENLLVLHVLVLALSPAAAARSLDARAGRVAAGPAADGRYGWPLRLMCVITVISYLIAAQAKLEAAGLAWITDDVLRNQVAYDNLRKIQLGDLHSPLGAALVSQAWLFLPLALMNFAVELGAPLALLGGRAARLWVLGALLLHWGDLRADGDCFPLSLVGGGVPVVVRGGALAGAALVADAVAAPAGGGGVGLRSGVGGRLTGRRGAIIMPTPRPGRRKRHGAAGSVRQCAEHAVSGGG